MGTRTIFVACSWSECFVDCLSDHGNMNKLTNFRNRWRTSFVLTAQIEELWGNWLWGTLCQVDNNYITAPSSVLLSTTTATSTTNATIISHHRKVKCFFCFDSVSPKTPLLDLLNLFQTGRSHLALVCNDPEKVSLVFFFEIPTLATFFDFFQKTCARR